MYEVPKIRKIIFLKFVLNDFEAAEGIYFMKIYLTVVPFIYVRLGVITDSSNFEKIYFA